jgi:hypothetical protein
MIGKQKKESINFDCDFYNSRKKLKYQPFFGKGAFPK